MEHFLDLIDPAPRIMKNVYSTCSCILHILQALVIELIVEFKPNSPF